MSQIKRQHYGLFEECGHKNRKSLSENTSLDEEAEKEGAVRNCSRELSFLCFGNADGYFHRK